MWIYSDMVAVMTHRFVLVGVNYTSGQTEPDSDLTERNEILESLSLSNSSCQNNHTTRSHLWLLWSLLHNPHQEVALAQLSVSFRFSVISLEACYSLIHLLKKSKRRCI